MKKLTLIQILIIPFFSVGQIKFVGEYTKILELKDTLDLPQFGYLYNSCFKINSDSTFFYYEEENPLAFEVSQRETIEGIWTSKGDTITFFNRFFKIPKGIKFNYFSNQNIDGIKIVVNDYEGKPLELLDNYDEKINRNTITVKNILGGPIFIQPKGHCSGFRKCSIPIHLDGIKKGTTIEVIVYSKNLEIKFNKRKYILTRNILTDYQSSDFKFIKTK